MELSNRYKRVPVGDIKVNRADRQRDPSKERLDVSDIVDSIRAKGVLQPILITRDFELVAGERRLQASKDAGHPDIPCRFIDELSPVEAQIVELEENLKRKNLSWQDEAKAMARLHRLYAKEASDRGETWHQTDTAKTISVSPGYLAETLRVEREIETPRIAQAPNLRAAFNMLARKDDRAISDAMSDLMEAGADMFAGVGVENPPVPDTAPPADSGDQPPAAPIARPTPAKSPDPESLLNLSFLEWAPQYSGPKFNFIHCDFPYGVNVFAGELANTSGGQGTYDDSPDVYWALIECFCKNLDRFMAHSAHMMFWLAADIEIQAETIRRFKALAPSLEFQTYPLIWHKSDNVGLLPDPKRGPRRVYETALIASREDRLIIKAVSNCYASPTNKEYHPSTKPEPMLRHYFQMFVDETTKMLDPTCGGGSALRAAESMGAQVLGLEMDPEHFSNAQSALRKFRTLRKASA